MLRNRRVGDNPLILEVKWCGFDYGETIMNAANLRNAVVFGDIYKTLGKPEFIPDKIRKYWILKEKYGSYPQIHEGHKDELFEFVLDNDSEAIALFKQKEQEFLDTADGVEEALAYLRSEDIEIYMVSEMKQSPDPIGNDHITRYLKRQGIAKYFDGLITPVGKIDFRTNTVDLKYKGSTKAEGTLYDLIAQDLKARGIEPYEAVMVGDRPETDITPAHRRGFKTIQYTGFINKGKTEADAVIESFVELKSIVRKKS
ncbi:MAG: HAD family hydrolase [Desulfobacteraceae bacterium]|jgi:FMN phosphatase YigB (HAD superfamily)